MTISHKEIITGAGDYLESWPIVRSIISNPVLLSLTIAVIMLIVIMIVFRNTESDDESVFRLALRATFYVTIASTVLILMHNSDIIRGVKNDHKSGNMEALFEGVDQVGNETIGAGEYIPITIKAPELS